MPKEKPLYVLRTFIDPPEKFPPPGDTKKIHVRNAGPYYNEKPGAEWKSVYGCLPGEPLPKRPARERYVD